MKSTLCVSMSKYLRNNRTKHRAFSPLSDPRPAVFKTGGCDPWLAGWHPRRFQDWPAFLFSESYVHTYIYLHRFDQLGDSLCIEKCKLTPCFDVVMRTYLVIWWWTTREDYFSNYSLCYWLWVAETSSFFL